MADSISPGGVQGNVHFVMPGEDVEVEDMALVSHVATLTATEPEKLLQALLFRTVATGGGDVIAKGHSTTEASYARDACAKVSGGPLPQLLGVHTSPNTHVPGTALSGLHQLWQAWHSPAMPQVVPMYSWDHCLDHAYPCMTWSLEVTIAGQTLGTRPVPSPRLL